MNKTYIDFLAKELINNKLVLFVGAGASIDSNLPNWNDLIKVFAKDLGYTKDNFTSEEFLSIPEEYYEKLGKVPFYSILESIFKKNFKPNSIHEAIEKMKVNYIITTNFDTLVEDQLNEDYDYDIIKKDEDLAHTSKSKMIIKMHGDLDNKNIILKKSDFDNYEKKFPLVSTFIKGLFTTNTILFMGYSLNDPNVKNIISLIEQILKEDFRKVYLIDYKTTTKIEIETEKFINKIILPDLDKEQYFGKTEEELLRNKGKLLSDFLEELLKNRDEKLVEETSLIYSKLDYLTNFNFKEIIKNFSIDFTLSTDGMISNKKINKKLEPIERKKYLEILIKSDVKTIENESIVSMINNNPILELLLKKQEKSNKIIEYMLEFDKEKIEFFLQENEEISTENIVTSVHLFFEEYDLAKAKLNKKLKEFQLYNDKEKILWTSFLLSIIEKINFDFSKEGINLEKTYNKYFKRKTNLYDEVINYKTSNENCKLMTTYLDETKKRKTSHIIVGETPLEKAQFLIRDFYFFSFFNGFYLSFKQIKNMTKEYIEILFIAYKNDLRNKKKSDGKIISLEKIEYIDYFFMIELSHKTLKYLFNEYNIITLSCEDLVLNKLINTLKNLLNIFQEEQFHFNGGRERLENILFLIYKNNLKEEQFRKILSILLNSNKFKVFYMDDFTSLHLRNYFLGILDKNYKYLSEEELKEMINQIITANIKTNKKVIGMLTYYYSLVISKKIEITEELENYFSINHSSVKLYFLRLYKPNIQKEEIQKITLELKKEFNLEIYFELLTFNYIENNIELEKNIIIYLDKIFSEKYSQSSDYDSIFYEINSLLNKNKFSSKLRSELKNYSNENFKYYLKENHLKNEWEYFLDSENFNYSQFKISDLNSFTEFGIQQIIEKGKENKEFMKMIYEYLRDNANNHILKGYLKFCLKEEL